MRSGPRRDSLRRAGLVAGLSVLSLALSAPGVLANDSTAELATGGLVLRRTADIEMRSEDLLISPSRIEVTYHFRNRSARPVTTVVAFPMPDMARSPDDSPVPLPDESHPDFLNFTTTVDGRPVRAAVERRAVLGGVDHTDRIRRLGLSLSPFDPAAVEALNRLPEAVRAELIAQGLVGPADLDGQADVRSRLAPAWTLRTTFYWTQVFPPGRDVVVHHRYRPAVASASGNAFQGVEVETTDAWREARETYCVDRAFLSSMRRTAARAGVDTSMLFEQRIRYVLVTGANWARPIGAFRMVVDTGQPRAIASFCGTGIRRRSPTRLEVRYRNFTPRRDVGVLILRPITE